MGAGDFVGMDANGRCANEQSDSTGSGASADARKRKRKYSIRAHKQREKKLDDITFLNG